MASIILVAESGSDINPELAKRYGIRVVPMHVTFDKETLDDGSFPAEQICDYYRKTKKLPKTSCSTPADFIQMFDRIHEQEPEAQILYLAYSSVTTASYQSALLAAEGRDYVTALDTKQVSAGQAAVVVTVAEALQAQPQMPLPDAVALAKSVIARAQMCFLPDNLEFLRAGGRVSNVAYLGSRILNLHPCIEILDGKLVATKKYRGKMEKLADQLIREYTEKYRLEKDCLWLIYTAGLPETVRQSAARAVEDCGFRRAEWLQAGGVITTHGGPAAFGLAGLSKKI